MWLQLKNLFYSFNIDHEGPCIMCSRVHLCLEFFCGSKECSFVEFVLCSGGCSPVSVSVVAMCEWQQAALFPEGPGPCRCPASSSYTVYTKLCMYKIEKSAKKQNTWKDE